MRPAPPHYGDGMTAELRRNLSLALAGLVAGLGLVAILFGGGEILRRGAEERTPVQSAPGPSADATPRAGPDSEAKPDARTAAKPPESGSPESRLPETRSAEAAGVPSEPAPESARRSAAVPGFDIVRVEPDGETVVAGRGAPNTTVELLVDGRAVARALTDPNGQFALVPPALKTGASELALRITDAQGRPARSPQSVSVVVADDRKAKPLVALTAPDRPTVVLSQPDAPPQTATGKVADAKPAPGPPKTLGGRDGVAKSPAPQGKAAEAAPSRPAAPTAAAKNAAPLRIVSVDAQEGGRLDIAGMAPQGATLRLYLNDTLVAPASVGSDGRVSFTIGKGVAPGTYRIRIDQVDSVTGAVRARSEVPFTVPDRAARVAEHGKPGGNPAAASPTPSAPAASGSAAAPVAPLGTASDSRRIAGTAPASPSAIPPSRGYPAPIGGQAAAPTDKNVADTGIADKGVAEAAPAEMALAPPAPGAVFVPEIGTARIARGDNLWQISRRVYGRGTRYTVIYDANQDQIRDPDRIYPGQIFVLPKEAERRG